MPLTRICILAALWACVFTAHSQPALRQVELLLEKSDWQKAKFISDSLYDLPDTKKSTDILYHRSKQLITLCIQADSISLSKMPAIYSELGEAYALFVKTKSETKSKIKPLWDTTALSKQVQAVLNDQFKWAYARKRFELAEEYLSYLQKSFPKDTLYLKRKLYLSYRLRQLDEAHEAYRKWLLLDTTTYRKYLYFNFLEFEIHDYPTLSRELERTIRRSASASPEMLTRWIKSVIKQRSIALLQAVLDTACAKYALPQEEKHLHWSTFYLAVDSVHRASKHLDSASLYAKEPSATFLYNLSRVYLSKARAKRDSLNQLPYEQYELVQAKISKNIAWLQSKSIEYLEMYYNTTQDPKAIDELKKAYIATGRLQEAKRIGN